MNLVKRMLIIFGMHKDDSLLDYFANWINIIIAVLFVCRIGIGIKDANDPRGCIVKSWGDVMISPFYAVGCNIGKNRFDYKLN